MKAHHITYKENLKLDNELEAHPKFRDTIELLEALRKQSSNGQDFWLARDIHPVLGYVVWDKFEPVIQRAKASLQANKIDPSHHIAQTSKMMGLGKGGTREGLDFFLSRAACRLIAMNGNPAKPEIAAAQAYFVVQAHRMEQHDALTADQKRLELRERVKSAHKAVSGAAKEAGVPNRHQGIFHDARYQGLYGMSGREVKARKGLKFKDNPFDFAGPLELSANEFQMNMTVDVIQKEGIKGEAKAIAKNREIAGNVRKTMRNNGVTMPENLPVVEPIKAVEKRLKQNGQLPAPKA